MEMRLDEVLTYYLRARRDPKSKLNGPSTKLGLSAPVQSASQLHAICDHSQVCIGFDEVDLPSYSYLLSISCAEYILVLSSPRGGLRIVLPRTTGINSSNGALRSIHCQNRHRSTR
jgi:hypothetical protein